MAMMPEFLRGTELVNLDLLRRYLVAHGWRIAETAHQTRSFSPPNPGSPIIREMLEGRSGGRRNFDQFVLSDPGLADVELVRPRESGSSDYDRQIRGAIRTLSDVEGRAPQNVIADVNQIGLDVVRACFPSSLMVGDSIPLRVAADYASNTRALLATVAHTEMWPVLQFPRLSKAALEYANHCRFGHTFRGSFGFTIGSPLEFSGPKSFMQADPAVPLARRVVERFVRGVGEICSVVNGGDESVLTENAERGFGANGYRRFAEVIESAAGNEIVLSFDFSSEWKLPPDLLKSESFSVGRRHLELSKSVAEILRKRHDDDMTASVQASMDEDDFSSDEGRSATVIGEVVRLARGDQSGNVADIHAENEIAIQWQRREFGKIRIWISLRA